MISSLQGIKFSQQTMLDQPHPLLNSNQHRSPTMTGYSVYSSRAIKPSSSTDHIDESDWQLPLLRRHRPYRQHPHQASASWTLWADHVHTAAPRYPNITSIFRRSGMCLSEVSHHHINLLRSNMCSAGTLCCTPPPSRVTNTGSGTVARTLTDTPGDKADHIEALDWRAIKGLHQAHCMLQVNQQQRYQASPVGDSRRASLKY